METIPDYLTRLASDAPTPGGGSAATIVAAAGASLVGMVARICAQNPKFAGQREFAHGLTARADALRGELLNARTRDEVAFEHVVSAMGLPKATPEQQQARRDALEAALNKAAAEPLKSARSALDVLRLAIVALELRNANLVSDVGCAAEFAHAALAACAYNVRINHRYMHDRAAIDAQRIELERYEREGAALLDAARRGVRNLLAR